MEQFEKVQLKERTSENYVVTLLTTFYTW